MGSKFPLGVSSSDLVRHNEYVEHPEAPIGKFTKYARPEHERRFLLSRVPPGLCIQRAEIDDRYLIGTRLRIRRTVETTATGRTTLRKLTQKIPSRDGAPGLTTNFYLNDAEYQELLSLRAVSLNKVRYRVPPLSVDVYSGALAGLLMGEIEFETREEEKRFRLPTEAVAEVTLDVRFTGGRLALTQRPDLLAILADFGLEPVNASELATRPLSNRG